MEFFCHGMPGTPSAYISRQQAAMMQPTTINQKEATMLGKAA